MTQADPILPPTRSESGRPCPGCLAASPRVCGVKNRYRLAWCSRCGVTFAPDPADPDEVRDMYDHYYDRPRQTIPASTQASLDNLVASCDRFRRTGRWLDIGYGEGFLLSAAECGRWSCFGTEVSPTALEFGSGQGWAVTADADGDPRFSARGFDIVTMIELLEHVPAPDQFLRSAARLLRPGGLLYFTTPNGESINRRSLGLKWSIFSPPEHLTIWTAAGARKALKRAGFRVQQIRTEGLNPSEMLARLRPVRPSVHAPSRNATAQRLNEAMIRNPLRRLLKAGINTCLSAMKLGDTLKVWATKP